METDQIIEDPAKNNPWIKCSEANLYQHGPTETYYVRHRLPGGKRTFVSLETKVITVARLRLKKKLLEVEETRQAIGEVPSEIRSLGEILDYARRKMDKSNAEGATKKHHKMRFDQLLKCYPGDLYKTAPKTVTEGTIVELRDKLLEELAPATVNHVIHTLNNLLDIALGYCLVVRHPLQSKDVRKRIFLTPETRRPSLPTKAQMLQIFEELEKIHNLDLIDEHLRPLLLEQAKNSAEHAQFLAFTGCRLNEGNEVTWEGVKADRFWVPGTKTDSAPRWVPIFPDMLNLLEKMRARRIALGLPLTGQILLVKDSKGRIKKICQRLGLPELRHHDLRHYFATICIESGVPIPTVADWMGHADGGATLMETYRHLRDEHSQAEAKKVSFAIASTAAQSTPA